MRLYEINEEPPIAPLIRSYLNKGYVRTGAPSASAIILVSKDRKQVVKIGKVSDCWLNFAETIRSSLNPHVPRIHSLEMYGNHYLAEIEFLRELPQIFRKSAMYQQIASYMYLNAKWENGRLVYLQNFNIREIKKMAQELEKSQPQMIQAMALIIACKESCNYDCHPENFMKRSDGTIVFNDPLTHQG